MIKKVLILGSGGLRIGQAGEFDYSGSQAIKALKEEKIKTVLVNPNIATVQTDPDMADEVYLEPLRKDVVEKIIAKERPDGILLGFGGQTALNLGLELHDSGVLKKYKVSVLGTPIKAIKTTEDRDLFKKALKKININTARSKIAESVADALKAAEEIGYPIMMRSGYSLGGLGSGIVKNKDELKRKAKEALNGAPHILIEEYLLGWKEVEYEIVRDGDGNIITVCNMENFDPMGIHTGESIVIAPSQTLNNSEYHNLRSVSLKTIEHIGIVGECNVQFALNPENGDYRVIEVNARLSRSSALASKATGYPLAFVAAKLSIGKRLYEIQNSITKKTSAFFEPSLDYVVVKMPRWDTNKLKSAERTIGSEMKSVGEVMAIGKSFPETLHKAIRMLNIGSEGLGDYRHEIPNLKKEIKSATDRRIFALYKFFQGGGSVSEAHKLSHIDNWFLNYLHLILKLEKEIKSKKMTDDLLRKAKKMGFSDKYISSLTNLDSEKIREKRIKKRIVPVIKQIDTLAGEFPAKTNYLYVTYHGDENDVKTTRDKPVIVLGSGPYAIGSSVEFDWCAVNTVRTLRKDGNKTIIINSNPETVSTDHDESDRLYFEELTEERVRDIYDFEKPKGIIVSMGGQIANNLVLPLHKKKYKILGTSPESIDRAEDRTKFSSLLNELNIDQPKWQKVSSLSNVKKFIKEVGYPVLVRPSYVLSGAAMNVIWNQRELEKYLTEATDISKEHPVVISQFIQEAKELEVDGVAKNGEIVIEAISEHIENAGVHSGDATIVLPPQRLYLETIRRTKQITEQIVKALDITGPFNMQFLAKYNDIKVIECNLRSSRSFPFVSKVTGHNFVRIATKSIMGDYDPEPYDTLELNYVGIKTPQFSYNRLKGANPVAHVEMASTGEVACIGDNYLEAFYKSWIATEQSVKGKRILITMDDFVKTRLLDDIKELKKSNWKIYTTRGTNKFLKNHGVNTKLVYKVSEGKNPNIYTLIPDHKFDLIINIPSTGMLTKNTDGYKIRRLAIDHHIPLITNAQIAQLFIKALVEINEDDLSLKSWKQYVG